MLPIKFPATKDGTRYIALLAFFIVLLFGAYHIKRVIQSGNEEYGEISRVAETAPLMMHFEDLKALNALPEDTLKPQYGVLKKMLAEIRRCNPSARFAYIFTIRDGKVLFMVDSEPHYSPDCSPPGQDLTEATALDKTLLNEGSQKIIEFSKDRWGNWVSILIPLTDPVTHRKIAVFGMDFDAGIWKARRWKDLLLASLIVLMSLSAIIGVFLIISKNQKLRKDNILLKQAESDLFLAKEKAEESDRLKTNFLKNISHEIRTPMNSILGFAGLLKEQDLSAEYKELYLLNMINSGQRMLNTIYDIIEMSRIQSGQVSLNYTRTDLAEQLYWIQEEFYPVAKDKGLDCRCTFGPDMREIYFYTDVVLLKSIFQKLLWNAFKFTKTGFVELGYVLHKEELEFYVKDSGVGVDDIQKTFIFDYFRQGNETMSRSFEGAGMGLAIAKAHVGLLGGRIWLESEPGVGSTFYFSIPYLEHAPAILKD